MLIHLLRMGPMEYDSSCEENESLKFKTNVDGGKL